MNRHEVTFTAYDGVKLAGTVYTAGERRPTIIMTQGVRNRKDEPPMQVGP